MKIFKVILFLLFAMGASSSMKAQCNQILTVHSASAECNGDGTSTVTITISVEYGNGNNSVVISYNLNNTEVNAIVLNKSGGDIDNMTYMFNVPSCDNYPVTLTAWTNPDGGGSSCDDPPPIVSNIVLPVEFGYFNVLKKERNVHLEWSTLSETNNEKFVIQKSKNAIEYTDIGNIKGYVNSNQERVYEFVDHDVRDGVSYYRIQQIDLDGQYSYSDVRSINSFSDYKLSVFPNPSSDMISISTQSTGLYKIVDTSNRVVETFKASGKTINLDISNLESGLYYIISADNFGSSSFIKL